MEAMRVNTVQECLQQTTKMLQVSEEKQNVQIKKLEKTLDDYKTEYSTSKMQILEMLTTMRQEQKDNHMCYLKETKSIRETTHTSIPNSQESISFELVPSTSAPIEVIVSSF